MMATIHFIRKALSTDKTPALVSQYMIIRDILTSQGNRFVLGCYGNIEYTSRNVFVRKGGERSMLMPDCKTEHINITLYINNDFLSHKAI